MLAAVGLFVDFVEIWLGRICVHSQSLSVSRLIFPLLETDRSSRPSSMPAAIIQALMPCLTEIGMVTVRMRQPLPKQENERPEGRPNFALNS